MKKTIYWEKGAKGFILESEDTLGRYHLILDPKSDPELEKCIGVITEKEAVNGNSLSDAIWSYAMYGSFRWKESAILYNSAENKIYLLAEDDLKGILLKASYPNNLKNNDMFEYKLLVKNTLLEYERNDLMRLAMVGIYVKNITK